MPLVNKIPTVVVSNFAEAHIDFLGRCSDPVEREALIASETYHADRTLLWCGDPKLVIVSYPIAHSELICSRLNYPNTKHAYPDNPTHFLCRDIVSEPDLLNKIVDYAGASRAIQLIPYATTNEFYVLIETLRNQYNLDVHTPETPTLLDFWLRDYIDTKHGFRTLASSWLKDAENLLPLGISCYNLNHAFQVAHWFNSREEACVLKADTGESGIGTFIIEPVNGGLTTAIKERLERDPYFSNELIIVEKYIPAREQISPSLEIMVPRVGDGEPEVTYVSRQLFLSFGDFCGIQVDKSLYQAPWYPILKTSGLTLAAQLQKMGYVGHFDMDCIVRDDGHLFLLEINARRTGGTHVHDFAKHYFGDDYIEEASFLSYEAMDAGTITDPGELISVLKDFLFPVNGDDHYGLIITITNALHLRRFGCIAVARTADQALSLQQKVLAHIREYSKL
ncbi:MAG TPA: hypothetical protein PLD32_13880 [Saprospiraceae bacterium]|nr:hypothetical protein [Saprospiraceae bacterium]